MPSDERDRYPICLVACKKTDQRPSPEKGSQSVTTLTSHSEPPKTFGPLRDFSSQVGASGIVIDHEKGLVITTALPFADFIPCEQRVRTGHQSDDRTSGVGNGVNHYPGEELKNLSVSVILQLPVSGTDVRKGGQNQINHSVRQPGTNRHHPCTNTVLSALHQPIKHTSSPIVDNETESFVIYNAKVVLLWRCQSFEAEMNQLMPSADDWELDYGDKRGEIGRHSHLMGEKDNVENGNEEARKEKSQGNLLSWFALLHVIGGLDSLPISLVPSSDLRLAQPVTACGTPFATLSPTTFYNSVSRGIVTKLSGKDLVMTDARCMPGMEGGGLFVMKNKQRYLAAMIISPLCWKANEWIGLTLACSMSAILDSLQYFTPFDLSRIRSINYGDGSSNHHTHLQNIAAHFQSIVLLRVGTVWGSGVIVDSQDGLILTCRHVIKNAQFNEVSLKVYQGPWMRASVLYMNPVTSALDLAILKVKGHRDNISLVSVGMDTSYQEGSKVYAVGFPLFDPSQSSTPSVTSGVVSKVIRIGQKPVMLQSSCAVHAGASGGALLCAKTGNLVGIIASNSRDGESGASFPHINFSIPVECFRNAIQQYLNTKDTSWFLDLEMTDERLTTTWALQENGTYIRQPQSKL